MILGSDLIRLLDLEALPDGLSEPPHSLPHAPLVGARVRRPAEQPPRHRPVRRGAEPGAPGHEHALGYARLEDLLLYFQDGAAGFRVLCVIEFDPELRSSSAKPSSAGIQ